MPNTRRILSTKYATDISRTEKKSLIYPGSHGKQLDFS